MGKTKRYFQGVKKEGKRVRWPKKHELWPAVAVVLVITIFAALCLACDDLLSNRLLSMLEDAFSSLKK